MSRRHRIVVFGALVAVLLALALLLARDSEPTYHHRTLDEWVRVYLAQEETDVSPASLEAQEAIRRLAAESLPVLVARVAYDPAPRRQRATTVARKVPTSLRATALMGPLLLDQDEFRANDAVIALNVQGPEAASAIPELARSLNSTTSPVVCRRVLWTLSHLGPTALPTMLSVITNSQHLGRRFALDYLPNLGTNAFPALPIVTEVMADPQLEIRMAATNTRAQLLNLGARR
jgi:hypothetical protein